MDNSHEIIWGPIHALRAWPPAEYRLAFRELGLSIGLSAVERLHKGIEENPNIFCQISSLNQRVEDLRKFMPHGEIIEQFWMDNKNRQARTCIEHREINMGNAHNQTDF